MDNITQGVAAQDLKMAKIRRVQAELEVITRAAQAYAVATGSYPAAINDLYGAMVLTVAYHITGAQDGDFGLGGPATGGSTVARRTARCCGPARAWRMPRS